MSRSILTKKLEKYFQERKTLRKRILHYLVSGKKYLEATLILIISFSFIFFIFNQSTILALLKEKREQNISKRIKKYEEQQMLTYDYNPTYKIQLSRITKPPRVSATATVPVTSRSQISIPKINKIAPIIFTDSDQEEAIQKDLIKGVSHYPGTNLPGELGDILIVGHSAPPKNYTGAYGTVFTQLNDLENGDEIIINYQSKRLVYRVFDKKITGDELKNIGEQNQESILVLMTCWPPGTTWKRLFVYSKLSSIN